MNDDDLIIDDFYAELRKMKQEMEEDQKPVR